MSAIDEAEVARFSYSERIVFDFDSHVCGRCRGKRAHQIGHVPVCAGEPEGDFMLRCTACGNQDGPYAGPRSLDAEGKWLLNDR